jgi:putative ABC transport system substrate-binding protein
LAARAQQRASGSLVGILSPVSPAAAARNLEALRSGLRDLGYIEGRNLTIEARFAGGIPGRLADLAAELVAMKPTVIVAGSLVSILAVANATRTIPVVMSATSEDPVAAGLAVSLARPRRQYYGILDPRRGNAYWEAAGNPKRGGAGHFSSWGGGQSW